jgi:hypothetical protein
MHCLDALDRPLSPRQTFSVTWMPCAGIPWLVDGHWEAAWHAIKTVFASKWNDVAVSSLHKAGLSHQSLQMAVLCQPVLPAHYAFVAHTVHPTSGMSDCRHGYGPAAEMIMGPWC